MNETRQFKVTVTAPPNEIERLKHELMKQSAEAERYGAEISIEEVSEDQEGNASTEEFE